jgi:hypothetical protein
VADGEVGLWRCWARRRGGGARVAGKVSRVEEGARAVQKRAEVSCSNGSPVGSELGPSGNGGGGALEKEARVWDGEGRSQPGV